MASLKGMQIDWTTEKQMIGVTFLIYILGIEVIMREKKIAGVWSMI